MDARRAEIGDILHDERQLQLLDTPRLGGELRAAARRPGATIGWFLIGPRAEQAVQFPGVDGPLLACLKER